MDNGEITASSTFTSNDLKGRYAMALYELASEKQVLNKIVEEASDFIKLIATEADLSKLLTNPSLETNYVRTFLIKFLEDASFTQLFRNFVGIVVNNRRLAHLKSMLQAFIALVDLRRGIVTADITSAYPLSEIQKERLKEQLAEAGYTKVHLKERIDEKLLGGFVIRIGAKFYDASLKSRLNRLHYIMKGAA